MSDLAGRIVVVGAGHAGGALAAELRRQGWTGPITLVGEEPYAPYQRPPLSKAWLKGEADADALALRPDSFYAEHAIELRLGARVTRLDLADRTVLLSDGGELGYDSLVLATGARPRALALPGADLDGVLALRTADDADRLKAALRPGARLVVIGGGYIGLEAAASARALGAEAVVLEREPRLLARVACPELSAFFRARHEAEGVRFVFGAAIEAIEGSGGRVAGVRLSGGETIAADVVLVGVGAQPNVELAQAAGLACDNGIVVDLVARTADPAVFAIGDCTSRPMPIYGRRHRLESVPNALEQAKQAAAALCGTPAPAPETPWFWSDQYDVKLQIAGVPFDATSTVLRGDPASGRFAVFHLDAQSRVQAVEAVNAPPEFMGGRQLIAARRPVDLAKLADTAVSMKAVAR